MSRLAAVLAAVLVALAACGGPSPSGSPSPAASSSPTPSAPPAASSSPTPPATPAPSATPTPGGDTAALFREIEDQVVAERGLQARQRLVPTILTQAEATSRLVAQYRKKNPPEKVAQAEETLKALGLLATDASLDRLTADMLGSQVAAFYDPEADELFVISRSGTIGSAEKVYFSHEFAHALQDQHFDVEDIDADAEGQGDRGLARLSLVEGDATLLMTRWMVAHLSPAELQEMLVVDKETQAQYDALPAILRETLMFPYQQGIVLALAAWTKGGWAAVDAMYDRQPASTEQVLHPEKYEADEKPLAVALDGAALAKGMGAGWSGTPEDTLGEFQISIWLRENGAKALAAQAAAAGWGGDRLAYLRGPDGAYALVLRTAWDTAADAAEFVEAAGTAVGDGSSPGTVVRSSATEVVVVLASDGAALNAAVDGAGLDLPD